MCFPWDILPIFPNHYSCSITHSEESAICPIMHAWAHKRLWLDNDILIDGKTKGIHSTLTIGRTLFCCQHYSVFLKLLILLCMNNHFSFFFFAWTNFRILIRLATKCQTPQTQFSFWKGSYRLVSQSIIRSDLPWPLSNLWQCPKTFLNISSPAWWCFSCLNEEGALIRTNK